MSKEPKKKSKKRNRKSLSRLFKLFKPYGLIAGLLLLLVTISNLLSLSIPIQIGRAIDNYETGGLNTSNTMTILIVIVVLILILVLIQVFLTISLSEKIAKDIRSQLTNKLSMQTYKFVTDVSVDKLLTNFTSDVDTIKDIVYKGFVVLTSSMLLFLGSSALLLYINTKLALLVLTIIPFLVLVFVLVFRKIRTIFTSIQENIDGLNRIITETIIGASLIRILNSQFIEIEKFDGKNQRAKNLGLRVLSLFGSLIPVINLLANLAIVIIIWYGGVQVINDNMSIGELTAFYSYLAILITPILIIGFISNAAARSFASYNRIDEILVSKTPKLNSGKNVSISGAIKFKKVSVEIDKKSILKEFSFNIKSGSKTAVLGPTASGKTQLIYLIAGLIEPTKGEIFFDNINISELNKNSLYSQVGLVFQDNVIFNGTIWENIAFSEQITKEEFDKAVETAELDEFIDSLPDKENSVITERGANLSGGQKQRLSLARALATSPRILVLDDFIARVDLKTEKQILENINRNYPNTTQLMVSQKISTVENFDQIILLMEGELVAKGKHKELLDTSLEYKQIFESQKSTNKL